MNVLSLARVVRRAGLDLPGRPPVRPARLHPDRHARGDPADPGAGDRLRAVDGLRGLPDVPDPRAVRPDRRQHRRRWRPGCSAPAGSSPAPRCCCIVVIGAFSLSGITFIKMIGVGDDHRRSWSTRRSSGSLLVPATMRLLGDGRTGGRRRRCAGSGDRYGVRECGDVRLPASGGNPRPWSCHRGIRLHPTGPPLRRPRRREVRRAADPCTRDRGILRSTAAGHWGVRRAEVAVSRAEDNGPG